MLSLLLCSLYGNLVKKKVIGINDVTSEAENLCIFSNAEVEMIRSLVEKKQEKEKEKNG